MMNMFQTEPSRWLAVQTRNSQADGTFVYCVKTTGVTCRPNCKARLARRSNVTFYDNYAEAKAAGFRACKRCKPDLEVYDPQTDVVAQACRTIEEAEEDMARVKLSELAVKAGLTKSHFHRVFKKVTGVTPKNYAVNLRAEKLLESPPLLSYPGLSPAAASSLESDDGLAPATPGGQGDDSGRCALSFTASDPKAKLGVHKTYDMSTNGEDNLLNTSANNPMKEIEYTIQPWASGFVLIAATKEGICWLEAGSSVSELSESLTREYPFTDIKLSAWPNTPGEGTPPLAVYSLFLKVMEALVNPTGKILEVSFDIF